jgi:hypothetical protein
MRILQISVFFRNDQPNGFGYTFDLPNLDDVWNTVKTNYDLMWADEPDPKLELIEHLTAQLEEICRRPAPSRTLQDAILALGNVYLLTTKGIMPSDEFNGILIFKNLSLG